MIGWELPPFNSGGLGVASLFLARALAAYVDLTFTLPKKCSVGNPGFPVLFATDDTTTPSPAYISSLVLANGEPAFGIFQEVFAYAHNLLKKLRASSSDIIHAHDWLSFPAAFALKEKWHIPVVCHVHATEIDRTGGNPNPLILQIEKTYLAQADRIAAVSPYTKRIVNEHYHIAPERIAVVPNGIDMEPTPAKLPSYLNSLRKQGTKIILFVGRLTLQKGPDYLLEAFPLVRQRIPSLKLVFVGSGEMLERLIQKAGELGVSDDVIFTSFLRDQELWGMYHTADVLVVPSVSDPFGLVPLEGVKNNVPVILSKTTGAGEMMAHTLRFDFWDINALANYLTGTLKYDELGNELKANASQELYKFDWNESAQKVLRIYDQLAATN